MLITFSSQSSANIIMFSDIAIKLLKLMGHSGKVPSALYADEVPAALSTLQTALDKQKQVSKQKSADENTNAYDNSYAEDDDSDEFVSLANRAIPLIKMLEAAVEHNTNVMWTNKD